MLACKSAAKSRLFEQAPRVDRPPSSFSYAAQGSLPATQGQRWTIYPYSFKGLSNFG